MIVIVLGLIPMDAAERMTGVFMISRRFKSRPAIAAEKFAQNKS
jgi:hypothetical protein